MLRLDEMSTEVPVGAPWASSQVEDWDGQTLETWVRDNSSSEAFRDLVPVATRPIFGAEPRDLSLLFVLFYIAASGDEQHPGTFERNFNTRNGAQMWRLVGGAQLLALKIAAGSASASCSAPRWSGSSRERGRHGPHPQGSRCRPSGRSSPSRRRSPGGSNTSRSCPRSETSSPSDCLRGR